MKYTAGKPGRRWRGVSKRSTTVAGKTREGGGGQTHTRAPVSDIKRVRGTRARTRATGLHQLRHAERGGNDGHSRLIKDQHQLSLMPRLRGEPDQVLNNVCVGDEAA